MTAPIEDPIYIQGTLDTRLVKLYLTPEDAQKAEVPLQDMVIISGSAGAVRRVLTALARKD